MLHFGFGRADISCYEPEMTMMGWGMRYNRARGVAVPLHARAVVVWDVEAGSVVALVSVETLLVTQGLWFAVLDALERDWPELGLGSHNVILSATHTHSGPSGFGHHFWTNLNAPGFSPRVFDGLRDGIVDAIVRGHRGLRPGRVRVAQTVVPLSDGVAFNRSWFAYNKNVDVAPVTRERRDEATDRVMTVLRFEDEDGRVGLVNWFALHGTCVHADNTELHPDHKGLAALELEAEGVDCVFVQECCGDVTPNYRWDPKRRHTMGRFDDDLASAEYVGGVEARHARSLLDGGEEITGPLQVGTRFVDFGAAPVGADFRPVEGAARTSPATLGLSMTMGTAEGPGPLKNQRRLVRTLNRLAGRAKRARGAHAHDPKFPFIQLARGLDGRLGGLFPIRLMPALDETFRWVRQAARSGGIHAGAWVPQIVPLQLVRIGSLAIAAFPFEMTTVAGRRLRQTLLERLPGVEHVVITPYCNAYVGYLTTFEEYQVQHYEAGYTLFGPYTLGALRTAFAGLADNLGATTQMGRLPPRVATEPLEKIRFTRPWAT